MLPLSNSDLFPSACVDCGASLPRLEIASGVEGAYCAKCRAAWLSDSSFCQYLGNEHWPEEHATVAESGPSCPACRKGSLERLVSAGKCHWQRCKECLGVWISVAELESLSKMVAATRADEHQAHLQWADRTESTRLKYLDTEERDETSVPPVVFPPFSSREIPVIPGDELQPARFAYDQLSVDTVVVPATFLTAWVIHESQFLPLKLFLGVARLALHEMGHAIVGLASSHIAIPFPLGFTLFFEGRSMAVFLACLLAPSWLGVLGWRRRWPFLLVTAVVFLLAQAYLNFFNVGRWEEFFCLGGVGGEFVLGTWLCLAYFHRMPDAVRWDFWRFVALPLGAYVLVSAYSEWSAIHLGTASIPWGTLLGGSEDSGGDMDRLVGTFGWTAHDLGSTFFYLGMICGALVLAHYAFFILREYRKRGA